MLPRRAVLAAPLLRRLPRYKKLPDARYLPRLLADMFMRATPRR